MHRALLAASMGAVVWGALAFGAVYPWAYMPLAAACGTLGLAALILERRGRPRILALASSFLAILLAVAVQLAPLPLPLLQRVSPTTDAFLNEYDFSYQLLRAKSDQAGSTADQEPLRHPISIAPDKTLRGAFLCAAFALFLLGTSRLLSVVGARPISRWLIAFGGLLALVGIVQRGLTATDVHPLIYGFWRPRYENVPFGPFVNPNHYAGWMLMALPIALAALFDLLLKAIELAPSGARNRIVVIGSPQGGAILLVSATCLLMGLSLLMTRSRSALAAFAVGSLLAGWVIVRRQGSAASRAAIAVTVLLMLGGTAAWAGFDTLTSKFTDTEHGRKPFSGRLQAWSDTVAIVRDFPLTGSGLDTYGTAMMVYQTGSRAVHYREAHNDYLQLAAEGGLLVGVPILITIGLFVRAVRRRFQEAPKSGTTYCLRVGAVAGLVSIALQSIVDFSLQMPGNAALFAVLGAIALHQSPNLRRSSSHT